mmetsp:Transcript_1742/g.3784  ORF Transcript_1742/g.3784 Transcript_1742/m.3784 type:complete len:215 (-) Transcript_1742:71-715(-)
MRLLLTCTFLLRSVPSSMGPNLRSTFSSHASPATSCCSTASTPPNSLGGDLGGGGVPKTAGATAEGCCWCVCSCRLGAPSWSCPSCGSSSLAFFLFFLPPLRLFFLPFLSSAWGGGAGPDGSSGSEGGGRGETPLWISGLPTRGGSVSLMTGEEASEDEGVATAAPRLAARAASPSLKHAPHTRSAPRIYRVGWSGDDPFGASISRRIRDQLRP